MKKNENPLIVSHIFDAGERVLRQLRPNDEVPKIGILERKKRDGKVDLHIAIRGLNRKDNKRARDALISLASHFKYVPEDELYARLFPEPRIPKKKKRRSV